MSSDPRLITRRADKLMRWFIAPAIVNNAPVPPVDGPVSVETVSLIGCGLGFHGALCPWHCRRALITRDADELREWQSPYVRDMLAR